ncbi:TPA: DUF4176 domain-containing protein [Streptococcus suis]|uniref:DUF4176 domain-containing protein n=1 Tax=Streptococcus TaxID=1301 RepID=UPI0015581450|nr:MULTISPECIES: DUF4176 domain-containing protein [Streptococcus]MBM7192297.1 DUF4176 domain-containing protein [Streptococcus suis]MBM7283201.1 DUF4176 domain-containing protein [Streptococcus suis]MBY0719128.1 DUF4176 domain-containing protein [Streptococcus sp. 2018110]MCO8207231.1 DUF4176 domain-containing protein [Streptococcus suis]MCO8211482.1 DUF4176 domain-containing protein [Streptococcus suis]
MSLLPVGSVVYLAEGNQKMVVLNRGAVVEQRGEEVVFDYCLGIYPEGLNPEQVYYCNSEDIDEVVFEGYSDDDENRFIDLYLKWLDEKKEDIKKGRLNN